MGVKALEEFGERRVQRRGSKGGGRRARGLEQRLIHQRTDVCRSPGGQPRDRKSIVLQLVQLSRDITNV